jgi:hypothetical protein
VILTGCSRTTAKVPAAPAQYRQLADWTGDGVWTSPPITTTRSPFKVKYGCQAVNEYGMSFSIIVLDAGTGQQVNLAANTMQPGVCETFVYAKPGSYALQIDGTNAEWRVEVFGE